MTFGRLDHNPPLPVHALPFPCHSHSTVNMKESAVLLPVPSHHVPEKEVQKAKLVKNKTALILYILILVFAFVLEIVCICQSQETMDLDSGKAGLNSIFYGCTVQCGSVSLFRNV